MKKGREKTRNLRKQSNGEFENLEERKNEGKMKFNMGEIRNSEELWGNGRFWSKKQKESWSKRSQ